MGTSYSIRWHGAAGDASSQELQRLVDARLVEVNRRMSTYEPESELSRFNRSESTDWFSVSAETARVVSFALEVAEDSSGAFDPTVGPVVNLWGFGPVRDRGGPPSQDEIAAAKSLVGFHKIEARLEPPALKKAGAGVYLDLSAVAKGYAADTLVELLVDQGVTGCMVEIGGEVATSGTKPAGEPWRIGVQQADATPGRVQEVVELSGQALATSGDYRNYFEAGGLRYSHTIDPGACRPVTHNLAAVSVRADSCMEADALATAVLVMGRERGYAWASSRNVAAILVERTEDGPVEHPTPAW